MYIKNGVIKKRNEIVIKENKNGKLFRVFNPSEEQIIKDGWKIYENEEDEFVEYKKQIINLIRERYSIDDEIAILRQRDLKPEEFETYNNFVERCKKISNRGRKR